MTVPRLLTFFTKIVKFSVTLNVVVDPVVLVLCTFLSVLACTSSPSEMRLYTCHMSSSSSGMRETEPCGQQLVEHSWLLHTEPSFSMSLLTSLMLVVAECLFFESNEKRLSVRDHSRT